LLVGAGLLGRSLYLLLQVDLGFHPDRLVALQIAAPFAIYDTPEKALALKRLVVERVSALPGVRSVAVSSNLPIEGWGNTMWFRVIGRPWHGEHNEVPVRSVSAEYFATLGARMAAGRGFTAVDEPGAPTVAVINRSMAAAYFHDEDPVGKQITPLSTPPKPITVVGVVEDIKVGGRRVVNPLAHALSAERQHVGVQLPHPCTAPLRGWSGCLPSSHSSSALSDSMP